MQVLHQVSLFLELAEVLLLLGRGDKCRLVDGLLTTLECPEFELFSFLEWLKQINLLLD